MRMLVGDGLTFREALADGGLQIGTTAKINQLLVNYVRSENPERYIHCVPYVGWLDRAYVFPESSIPENADVGYQSLGRGEHFYKVAGTLESWQENISRKCIGNSRLALAVSSAFAGPLLRPLNIQGGGFHFYSLSSMGKSTTLSVAGSVWGGGGRNGFTRSWAATKNAIESIAELHNDATLFLDEIRQIENKEVEPIIYMLANGAGKARENRSLTGRRTLQWQLMILSSGEIPLSECAALANQKIRGGVDTRLVSIPADSGAGMGIFERLHDTNEPHIFAETLEAASRCHYGTAIRAFLERLIADWDRWIHRAGELIDRFIRNNMEKATVIEYFRRNPGTPETFSKEQILGFIDDPDTLPDAVELPEAAAEVGRVLRRFALAAAAGEIPTEMGITSWPPEEATKAAQKGFLDWLAEREGIEASDTQNALLQVRSFLGREQDRFRPAEPRTDHNGNTIHQHIHHQLGYIKEIDDETIFLIDQDAFREEICRGFSHREVARDLFNRGLLIRNEGQKLIRREEVTLPNGAKPRLRFYAIRGKILGE
jgi:uncharacterized protein (DUF927 family)